MTYRISKDFTFAASHQLDGLPGGHKCGRLHGHNYLVRVQITGDTLDPAGMVVDYGDLDGFAVWIGQTLDHRHLNDVLPAGRPSTAESLAEYLAVVLRATLTLPAGASVCVGVSETPKTWAWWDP